MKMGMLVWCVEFRGDGVLKAKKTIILVVELLIEGIT